MEDEKVSVAKLIGAILVLLSTLFLAFLAIAAVTWVICWGFDKVWSWKVAIGAAATMTLVIVTLRAGTHDQKD